MKKEFEKARETKPESKNVMNDFVLKREFGL